MRRHGTQDLGQLTRQQLESRLNELEIEYELGRENLAKGWAANYEVIIALVVVSVLALVQGFHDHLSMTHYVIAAVIIVVAVASRVVVIRMRETRILAQIKATEDALADAHDRESR